MKYLFSLLLFFLCLGLHAQVNYEKTNFDEYFDFDFPKENVFFDNLDKQGYSFKNDAESISFTKQRRPRSLYLDRDKIENDYNEFLEGQLSSTENPQNLDKELLDINGFTCMRSQYEISIKDQRMVLNNLSILLKDAVYNLSSASPKEKHSKAIFENIVSSINLNASAPQFERTEKDETAYRSGKAIGKYLALALGLGLIFLHQYRKGKSKE